ncbi:B-cell receptor CD22-like [Pseudochaenichthys georgianus]|uniref:B-cell receptor CD22-like n=1 Tax=Pseudochaenichthys georgianus TaxID=52239 RepID=UPI00146DDC0D|nr:B-cell receptor CD22-like [Pseudochaenichthys georgianus]
MRGAAMSLTAATSGLVVFLLSVSAAQGEPGWGVAYASTEICAVKGSTVEMRCSYTYPSTWKGSVNTVRKTFWFTKWKGGERVDVTTDSEYRGRVEALCGSNICTLSIRNLRESDSAEYKFRITTAGGSFTGSHGVSLNVTDLTVQVGPRFTNRAELKCQSSCDVPSGHYVWNRNAEKPTTAILSTLLVTFGSTDRYSCALKGHEHFPSPAVYAPKPPSVSVSPSAEIEEGRSVTLTCSSDANPAASYTWYKEDGNQKRPPLTTEPQLVFSSIQSADSGQYSCTAENELGRTSEVIPVDVKYAPKPPSVSMSPSAEREEGSSVTLTCSSDANPAASYTWYKENEDSPKASGQIFTITDFRAEHIGSYSCGAQNKLGRSNSTFHLRVVAGSSTMIVNILRTALGLSMLIPVCLLGLWARKKKALRSTTEAREPEEMELDCFPVYENRPTPHVESQFQL